jgi:phytoene dehydrogenase-like protein
MTMPSPEYDVVIIGAGHNGLVAANYLQDAGLDVVVVEAAPKLGGMTTSVRGLIPEAPEHVINPCAVDPIWWEGFPASADLGLERYGLEMIHIDPCYAYLHPEGDSIAFWRDPQRTAEEIRHFSPADGDTYLEFARLLHGFYEVVGPLANTNPTRPGAAATAQLTKAMARHRKDLWEFASIFISPAAEIINERFKHPFVRNALHVLCGALAPTTIPGSTFMIVSIPMIHSSQASRPRGGVGAIADALAARLLTGGGIVLTSSPVREIIVSADRSTGVALADGSVIRARRAVLATCDPVTALQGLLPTGSLPSRVESRVANIPVHQGGWASLKVDVAFSGKLDLSRHNKKRRDGLDLRIPSHWLGNEDGLSRAFARAATGLVPDPADLGSWSCIPTALDPSQAPEGRDVLYIWTGSAPSAPEEGWNNIKQKAGQVAVDHAALHYDGVGELEIGRYIQSHEDLARNHWCQGQITHIDTTLSRNGPMRPTLGLGGYRTPVDGLYIGGAGSHPGGGVTGAPGHNAAKAILKSVKTENRRRRVLAGLPSRRA